MSTPMAGVHQRYNSRDCVPLASTHGWWLPLQTGLLSSWSSVQGTALLGEIPCIQELMETTLRSLPDAPLCTCDSSCWLQVCLTLGRLYVLSRKKRMAGDAEKEKEGNKHTTLLLLVRPCTSFMVNFQWISVSHLTAEVHSASVLPYKILSCLSDCLLRTRLCRCLSLPTGWEPVKLFDASGCWNVFALVFESKDWWLFN